MSVRKFSKQIVPSLKTPTSRRGGRTGDTWRFGPSGKNLITAIKTCNPLFSLSKYSSAKRQIRGNFNVLLCLCKTPYTYFSTPRLEVGHWDRRQHSDSQNSSFFGVGDTEVFLSLVSTGSALRLPPFFAC